MKNTIRLSAFFLFSSVFCLAQESKSILVSKASQIDFSNLVWTDEFTQDGKPDETKWSYDLGGHGWGNNELQNYTDSPKNVFVKNGLLNIIAIKEISDKNSYSSARLVTKNKADFTYGRFEVKAKLPSGRGTWPAIWMLPTVSSYSKDYWPDNGEIDIMEHVGYDQDFVHGSIHTKSYNHVIGTQKTSKRKINNVSDEFHVYAVNWLPELISFEIDGEKVYEVSKAQNDTWKEWPFDKKFHLLINIAIGGGWGGQKGIDESVFPQSMQIDYVKVFGIK